MTTPAEQPMSAYARVFAATSETPTSAKSIATATGMPYKQVTTELARLLEQGQVEQHKDGTRTLWTRAAHVPAGHVPDEPLSDDEQARIDGMHDAADVPAGDGPSATIVIPGEVVTDATSVADTLNERIDAVIAALPSVGAIDGMKRDALVELCRDLGLATNPRDNRAKLIEMAKARIDQHRQAKRDAARPDFAGMNVAGLRDAAKTLGVKGASKMNRDALVIAVNEAWEANADAVDDAADAPADETPAGDAQSDAETSVVPDGPWGSGDASGAPTGSIDAVLADLQATRPVSAPPAQSVAPRRAASGRPAGGIVSNGTAPAWARGQCEATLLAMMQAFPDQEHSATSLVKLYNDRRADGQPIMQPGSTAFALDAMVKKGKARLTQDKPKRYAAAVVPIPSA